MLPCNAACVLFMTAYSIDMKTLARRAAALGYESPWAPDRPEIPVHFTMPKPRNASQTLPAYYRHIVDPFVAPAGIAALGDGRLPREVLRTPEQIEAGIRRLGTLCGGARAEIETSLCDCHGTRETLAHMRRPADAVL